MGWECLLSSQRKQAALYPRAPPPPLPSRPLVPPAPPPPPPAPIRTLLCPLLLSRRPLPSHALPARPSPRLAAGGRARRARPRLLLVGDGAQRPAGGQPRAGLLAGGRDLLRGTHQCAARQAPEGRAREGRGKGGGATDTGRPHCSRGSRAPDAPAPAPTATRPSPAAPTPHHRDPPRPQPRRGRGAAPCIELRAITTHFYLQPARHIRPQQGGWEVVTQSEAQRSVAGAAPGGRSCRRWGLGWGGGRCDSCST